jgi:hypothetical protein
MPNATSTSNQNTMGRAQRRKAKKFEQKLFTALSHRPNGEFYRNMAILAKAAVGEAEWDQRLVETQSFLESERENKIERISEVTSLQASTEVRLLLETGQESWAYRYPASDSFKASTGCDQVIVAYSHGFLRVLGVPADA